MDYERFRKISLSGFIGFLALTALIAIIAVLTDSFDTLQIKILATTFSISAASVCAMICAVYGEKLNHRNLAIAGISTCLLASLLVIAGIWLDVKDETYWKVVGSFITLALSSTHSFLLQLPVLRQTHRWVQKAAMWSIGILAVQILIGMWMEIEADLYYRAVAVVSIFIGFETLVIPILMKLRSSFDSVMDTRELRLNHMRDDIYVDAMGRTYVVRQEDPTEAN